MDLEKYGIGEKNFKRIPVEKKANWVVRCHGEECLNDYDALFWKQFWNIGTMATKYGISRQRVSQVFKQLYPGVDWRVVKKEKKRLLDIELRAECQLDPIAKYDSLKKGRHGHLERGLEGEAIVFRKAVDMGLSPRSSQDRAIDMMVGNNKVEIKTASKTFKTDRCINAEYYRFNVSKKQAREADFFIFFIHADVERFFIIPRCMVNAGTNYIPSGSKLCEGYENRHEKSKLLQFEDAWHLLR